MVMALASRREEIVFEGVVKDIEFYPGVNRPGAGGSSTPPSIVIFSKKSIAITTGYYFENINIPLNEKIKITKVVETHDLGNNKYTTETSIKIDKI